MTAKNVYFLILLLAALIFLLWIVLVLSRKSENFIMTDDLTFLKKTKGGKYAAIYNDVDYHEEVYPVLLEQARRNNWKVDIFQKENKWNSFINSRYPTVDINFMNCSKFKPYLYDLILVVTLDNEIAEPIKKYKNILCIAHLDNVHKKLMKNIPHKKIIAIRPNKKYNFLWSVENFESIPSSKKKDIIAMVGNAVCNKNLDQKIARDMGKFNKLNFIVINRTDCKILKSLVKNKLKMYVNSSPEKMYKKISKAKAVIVPLKTDSNYIDRQMSGVIPIAISCLVPLIMPMGMAKSYNLQNEKCIIAYEKKLDENKILDRLNTITFEDLLDFRRKLLDYNDKKFKELAPLMYSDSYKDYKGKIPKIIHFVWIDKKSPFENRGIPEKYVLYLKGWKIKNQNFEIKIWQGGDIYSLIKKHFPQYEKTYKKINKNIIRCDIARFIILYIFGGVYSDLDFIARKNIGELIEKHDTWATFELPEHGGENNLFNGFLASVPKNSFIKSWFEHLFTTWGPDIKNVLEFSGPIGFAKFYRENGGELHIGSPCDIFPTNDKGKISSFCDRNCEPFTDNVWRDGSGWGYE